ncbi:membrane protein [Salmonella enterica subsp. enterica]|uniref:Membrane protein n=4 Tax=Salmonella enterica TaxID=28901 RepID=A0A379WLB5_SALET|nr:membrane protein [Salmonella enterica subsp. enterica]
MKIKTTVATLSILSVSLFWRFRRRTYQRRASAKREAIGSVSVSAIGSSPMDMNAMLSKKADEQGATAYHITEARSGSNWHATAELYKIKFTCHRI